MVKHSVVNRVDQETQNIYLLKLFSHVFQNDLLELVTTAIVCFFAAQPSMLDQVPQLGHIPKLFAALQSRNDAIPQSAVRIVHQMVNSEVRIDLVGLDVS